MATIDEFMQSVDEIENIDQLRQFLKEFTLNPFCEECRVLEEKIRIHIQQTIAEADLKGFSVSLQLMKSWIKVNALTHAVTLH